MERYRRLKRQEENKMECLIDAMILDRIHNEQAGIQCLEGDNLWMDLLITQMRTVLVAGTGTTTDTCVCEYIPPKGPPREC